MLSLGSRVAGSHGITYINPESAIYVGWVIVGRNNVNRVTSRLQVPSRSPTAGAGARLWRTIEFLTMRGRQGWKWSLPSDSRFPQRHIVRAICLFHSSATIVAAVSYRKRRIGLPGILLRLARHSLLRLTVVCRIQSVSRRVPVLPQESPIVATRAGQVTMPNEGSVLSFGEQPPAVSVDAAFQMDATAGR